MANFSFYAINRIAEMRKDEVKKNNPQPILSDAREKDEEYLLNFLSKYGISVNRSSFQLLTEKHLAAQSIYREWFTMASDVKKTDEEDWFWYAAVILWERWFPSVPNFEMLDDSIARGYDIDVYDKEAADLWKKTWEMLLLLLNKSNVRCMGAFDDLFMGSQSINNWLIDYDEALENASSQDSLYNQKRLELAESLPNIFPEESDDIKIDWQLNRATSLYDLGKVEEAEKTFLSIVTQIPHYGWGWIKWADCYWLGNIPDKNFDKAEDILKRALLLDKLEFKKDVLSRMLDLYSEWGIDDEYERTHILLDDMNHEYADDDIIDNIIDNIRIMDEPKAIPLRVESIGRNDPCTCGSGKKFKKCCG